MNFWSGFTRTAAETDYAGHRYRVDLRQFTPGKDVTLSRDGTVIERASTPASFDLGGGAVIKVTATEHGFSKAELRTRDGTTQLEPADGTWEAARQKWGRRHPVADRMVSTIATTIVIVGLIFVALQLLETITSMDFVADLLDGWRFSLPFTLGPLPLIVIGVAIGAGSLDRALRMR